MKGYIFFYLKYILFLQIITRGSLKGFHCFKKRQKLT